MEGVLILVWEVCLGPPSSLNTYGVVHIRKKDKKLYFYCCKMYKSVGEIVKAPSQHREGIKSVFGLDAGH